MREQDYRRAVGSIRWSPEKRSAIEEQLRRPARFRSKKVKEIEQILNQHPVYRGEQEEYMKKERKKARIYLYILAAAMLTIGGTAAAIAYSSKHNGDSQGENSISEEDLENAVILPNLTDQQDTPDAHGLAKADGGFFFIGGEYNPDDARYVIADAAIRYYDEESGETAYLCAKPNCLHNGSDFCTATTENYLLCSQVVYLDGYVYAIALDQQELLKKPDDCNKFPTVLLRYAPDGTEITPVAQLYFAEDEYELTAELIAHRGQLWMNCSYMTEISAYDANMNITDRQQYGRCEMFCYEPETQKLTSLCSSGDWQKDYTPFSSVAADLKGVGDYVYFHKWESDWRDPVKGCGIFRIDCRTGVISQVVDIDNNSRNKDRYYSVSGNHRYYSASGDRIYYCLSDYFATNPEYHVFDLTTGEDTELLTLETIVQSVYPDFVCDEEVMQYHRLMMDSFFVDDTYLHILWTYYEKDEAETDVYNPYIGLTVLDTDGKIVKTVNLRDAEGVERPREILEIQATKYADYFDIKTEKQKNEHLANTKAYIDGWGACYDNGTFYLKSDLVQYRLTVEDILHGRLKPEPLYIYYVYK